jgi:hypothetical protein
MQTLDKEKIDFYGYQIPSDMKERSKEVIKTLAECGCVEVFFRESLSENEDLLMFAKDYGITVYKSKYSFILYDNPVTKVI